MSTMTLAEARPVTRRSAPAPIPFSRVVAVEARKTFDTRSGFWLLTSIGITATLATIAVLLWAPDDQLTYDTFAAAIGFPMAVILPMVAILAVTSEWSQRSGLTTFTLVPHRDRVVRAKAVVAVGIGHVATFGGWGALVAAMILAAALWWLYFDSAADLNLRVLELSGGSPTMARAIFAVGHMLPCFALLLMAAGLGLLLEEDPPPIAYTLASVGLGIYLLGTRVFLAPGNRVGGAVRVLLLIATFALHRLHTVMSPHVYVWVLAAWGVGCAALAVGAGRFMQDHGFGDLAEADTAP